MLIVNVTYIMIILFFLIVLYLKLTFGFGWASLVAQRLKHLPAIWETRVWSLGGEDPLEKEMATHSSILAWRILWTEEPGGLQSMGLQRVGHDWATSLSLSLSHHEMWRDWERVKMAQLCLLFVISYIMENRIVFSAVCLYSCSHYLLSLHLV